MNCDASQGRSLGFYSRALPLAYFVKNLVVDTEDILIQLVYEAVPEEIAITIDDRIKNSED
jgi:hypothetical protein